MNKTTAPTFTRRRLFSLEAAGKVIRLLEDREKNAQIIA